MKSFLFTIFILLCFLKLACCQDAKNGRFEIYGKVSGRDTGIICLYYKDINNKSIKDTVHLKDGTFYFSGKINEPTEGALAGNIGGLLLSNPNLVQIFLEPAVMVVRLKQNEFKQIEMNGSQTQNQSRQLDISKENLLNRLHQLNNESKIIQDSLSLDSGNSYLREKKNILNDSIGEIRSTYRNKDLEFISSHKKSYLSLYLINFYFSIHQLSLDSAKELFAKLDANLKTSSSAKKILNAFNIRNSNGIGLTGFDFSKQDLNKQNIKLSSFRHKSYVLLDFWASWCVPCIEIKPELKKIRNKYKNGLAILAISIDKDKKKWISSVFRYKENNYVNILDTDSLNDSIHLNYDISEIPALVLIDKNGTIIGRYLGVENDKGLKDLDEALQKIFFSEHAN